MLLDSFITLVRQSKSRKFDFHERNMDFELKLISLQISIKWPEMIVFGSYIAQNRYQRSILYAEHITLANNKLMDTKMSKKYFCHFWFRAICVATKICLILKSIPPKLYQKYYLMNNIKVSVLSYLKN